MHYRIKFILFWNDTLHVSDGLSVHHQEFKNVHTVTGVCQTDTAVCLLAGTRWKEFHLISNLFYFGMTRDGTRSISYPLASRQQYLFNKCLLLYVQS